MRIVDMHCDVISKILVCPHIDVKDSHELDVNLNRMKGADITLQGFAIYLPQSFTPASFEPILRSIDLFYSRIESHSEIELIRYADDLESLKQKKKIGALLTLEGVDGLQGNLSCLRILFHLGVRCIGITWNYANWAADGVMEARGGGFTFLGRSMVRECQQLGILLDVSHLCEKAFWELAEMTNKPLFASHSNAYELCPHPRNLKDEQIKAILRLGGVIGITFVPWFVRSKEPVKIEHLLSHIDHVCALGGEQQLGFGSDFDGIDKRIIGLEHTGKFVDLAELLSKYYKDDLVSGFLGDNWLNFFSKNLPKKA